MPKLNVTHLVGRIQERIEKLERVDALEARDINALLNKEQLQALKDAWTKQQALRKIPKPPKSNEEENSIGWKVMSHTVLRATLLSPCKAYKNWTLDYRKSIFNPLLCRLSYQAMRWNH